MARLTAIKHEKLGVSRAWLYPRSDSSVDFSQYSSEEESALPVRREQRVGSPHTWAGLLRVHMLDPIKTFAKGLFGIGSPPLIDAWFQKVAEQGDAPAQAYLGRIYYEGLGVTQDFAQASAWFRKAAAQGNAVAQFGLGKMYCRGEGVPQDYALAAMWFRKAADQGNIAAQAAVGEMYAEGQGVPKDYAQAIVWLREAADQGDPGAQIQLGRLYLQADGVPRDCEQATLWFSLAARASDIAIRDLAARLRDEAATYLTAAQTARAQQRANDWKPKL
ncbi:MAG: sel1 repeat family protein [Hyphomicrobiales bacterium]|nr:sel1 repeat family protein [Hyphomicrobiales bacterium]